MTDELQQRMYDAKSACQAILSFTEHVSLDAYTGDLLLRSAVERQFEILGEALNRADALDDAIVEQLPDLPRIVGMRNRIIHGYDSVDDEIIWDAIQNYVPKLLQDLTSMTSR